MPTLFTRIITGELPGTFVWRDDTCVAFMSINPLQRGHTLVVPVTEVDHWVDLAPELSSHLFDVSRRIATAIADAFEPVKVGMLIAGLEVPHTHIHLSPIFDLHDLDFANAARSSNADELESAAALIRAALTDAGELGVSRT